MSANDPVDLIVAAVVETINAAELLLPCTATAPDFLDPTETDTDLHVAVFPRADIADSWFTEETDQSDISVAILIRQFLDPYDAAQVADLRAFARELRNVLRNAHPLLEIDGYPVNLWQIEHQPLWVPELLRTQQLFLSILLVTYRTEYEA